MDYQRNISKIGIQQHKQTQRAIAILASVRQVQVNRLHYSSTRKPRHLEIPHWLTLQLTTYQDNYCTYELKRWPTFTCRSSAYFSVASSLVLRSLLLPGIFFVAWSLMYTSFIMGVSQSVVMQIGDKMTAPGHECHHLSELMTSSANRPTQNSR